ncbi:enoyl-CoA hydratase/isomerase [uncultured Aquimarina sp.]|uniref:enoyl-CoA hydratase/isomerase n=1 Tax=uncultured Aquimarina sp. TaxID=575652 RepID=UPI002636C8F8|nr:enoyl-CoA hydratase/isomerase [uncultured Aquimarina sp.]
MHTEENPFKTIKINQWRQTVTIKINRPEANNAIDLTLINEITKVFTQFELDKDIKVVLFEGLPDFFCTGLEFKTIEVENFEISNKESQNKFYDLLKSIAFSSKVTIAKVKGKVNAGGIGIIASCDIVIADHSATFGLSEALFGLLPACVMPFLIRRVGYQKAQWMALITQGVSVDKALEIGLVDEIGTNLEENVRKNLLRLTKLETDTIKELKEYMGELWIINEQTKELAVNKISSLLMRDTVRSKINSFVNEGKMPWNQ